MPASCPSVDECQEACPTCAGLPGSNTCLLAGQLCDDPNPLIASDWECKCITPQQGTKVGAAATCTLDECAPASACRSDQDCNDPSNTVIGDFWCTCKSDARVKKQNGPVDSCPCATNECGPQQTCDRPTVNGYKCTCMSDPTVTSVNAPATCPTAVTCELFPCSSPFHDKQGKTAIVCGVMLADCSNDKCCNPEENECDANPTLCGTAAPPYNQDCSDPNRGVSGDFWCTCHSNNMVKTQGAPTPICPVNECDANPCGPEQSCSDGDYYVTGDYKCTCVRYADQFKVGGPARCFTCDARSCSGQYQDKMDKSSIFCGVTSADCTLAECCNKDECQGGALGVCGSDPAPRDQYCYDPDKSVDGDFWCKCQSDNNVKNQGAKVATCPVNECLSTPCGAMQTCTDTDLLVDGNYVCACTAKPTITQVGGPAACASCATHVCTGAFTDKTGKSDIICGMATSDCTNSMCCDEDECAGGSILCGSDPAPRDQYCYDPDKSVDGDYFCKCQSDNNVKNQGAKVATCPVNECLSTPCGAMQTCTDTDLLVDGNYVCACTAKPTITQVGGPAACASCATHVCTGAFTDKTGKSDIICGMATSDCTNSMCCDEDECAGGSILCGSDPAPRDQYCYDPDKSVDGDYFCKCQSDNNVKNQGAKVATCPVKECLSTPCGAMQTCTDTDLLVDGNYVCACTAKPTITQVGGPATCVSCAAHVCTGAFTDKTGKSDIICGMATSDCTNSMCCDEDECAGGSILCGSDPAPRDQYCYDPDKSVDGDYFCKCQSDNNVKNQGAKVATCPVKECLSTPCGAMQTCTDTDLLVDGNYVCACTAKPTITQVGGPATCVSCAAHVCTGAFTDKTGKSDIICGMATSDCTNSMCCDEDECAASTNICGSDPAPRDQVCEDPDKSVDGDYFCKCQSDNNVKNQGAKVATCPVNECLSTPCGAMQTCTDTDLLVDGNYVCACTAKPTITQVGGPAACASCATHVCTGAFTDKTGKSDIICGMATSDCTNSMCCDEDECAGGSILCGSDPAPRDQYCYDPDKSVDGDYFCKCQSDNNVKNQGAKVATCPVNECLSTPCGAMQTCTDTDLLVDGNYVCACTAKPTITQVGGPATCVSCAAHVCTGAFTDKTGKSDIICGMATSDCTNSMCCDEDECAGGSILCGSDPAPRDQYCYDPDKSVDGDYFCKCQSDNNVKNQGAKVATCPVKECLSTPCGAMQTCTDTDLLVDGNYVCACTAKPTITQVGGPATCVSCAAHVCTGAFTDKTGKSDIICGMATSDCTNSMCCDEDECAASTNICGSDPAPRDQVCEDPDKSVDGDYFCKCQSDNNVKNQGAKVATCPVNECLSTPCGAMQTCTDTDLLVDGNYVCACTAKPTITQVGGPAACASCATHVCTGAFTDKTGKSDIICGMATSDCTNSMCCDEDECAGGSILCGSDPAPRDQYCYDPDKSVDGDYFCKCQSDNNVKNQGAKVATCPVNECLSTPCGAMQTCTDTDLLVDGNYVCACTAKPTITQVGGPATCVSCAAHVCTGAFTDKTGKSDIICGMATSDCTNSMCCDEDECAGGSILCGSDPAPRDQYCYDPDKSVDGDYFCKCQSDNNVKNQGAKVATCPVKECLSTPCGAMQTCTDTDLLVDGNYVCACTAKPTITQVGGPATCVSCAAHVCTGAFTDKTGKSDIICGMATSDCTNSMCCDEDECAASTNICGSDPAPRDQVCEDPDKSVDGDYFCKCQSDNNVKNQGAKVATCPVNECLSTPCGAMQTCTDTDLLVDGNYVCACTAKPTITQVGGPAACASCATHVCTGAFTDKTGKSDIICGMATSDCTNSMCCDEDECAGGSILCGSDPAPRDQYCYDPDKSVDGDYFCKCQSDNNVKNQGAKVATCPVNECLSTPCGAMQTCTDTDLLVDGNYVCACTAKPTITQVGGPATCVSCAAHMCTGAFTDKTGKSDIICGMATSDCSASLCCTLLPTAVPKTDVPPTSAPDVVTDAPLVPVTVAPPTAAPPAVQQTLSPANITAEPDTLVPDDLRSQITLAPSPGGFDMMPAAAKKAKSAAAKVGDSAGAIVGIASVVGGASTSAAPGNIMIISNIQCDDSIDDSEDLDLMMHPLQFRLNGVPAAGAIVGNVVLWFVVVALFMGVAHALSVFGYGQNLQAEGLSPFEKAASLMRYPSACLPFPMLLFAGVLQSSFDIIINPRDSFSVNAIGYGGMCMCLIFTYALKTVSKEPRATVRSLTEEEAGGKVKRYFMGVEGWASDEAAPLYVESHGVVFDIYRDMGWLRGNYFALELLILYPLAAIVSIRSSDWGICFVKVSSLALILLAYSFFVVYKNIFLVKFLTHVTVAGNVTMACGLLLMGVAYLSKDMGHPSTTAATAFFLVSMVLCLFRAVYDMLTFIYDMLIGYRAAKRTGADARKRFTHVDSDGSDDDMPVELFGILAADMHDPDLARSRGSVEAPYYSPAAAAASFCSGNSGPHAGSVPAPAPVSPASLSPQPLSPLSAARPGLPGSGRGGRRRSFAVGSGRPASLGETTGSLGSESPKTQTFQSRSFASTLGGVSVHASSSSPRRSFGPHAAKPEGLRPAVSDDRVSRPRTRTLHNPATRPKLSTPSSETTRV